MLFSAPAPLSHWLGSLKSVLPISALNYMRLHALVAFQLEAARQASLRGLSCLVRGSHDKASLPEARHTENDRRPRSTPPGLAWSEFQLLTEWESQHDRATARPAGRPIPEIRPSLRRLSQGIRRATMPLMHWPHPIWRYFIAVACTTLIAESRKHCARGWHAGRPRGEVTKRA